MSGRLQLVLALAAGFAGGMVTRYVAPAPVLAQAQPPALQEIRAQSFVLVDNSGSVVGTFRPSSPQPGRTPAVVLLDSSGREVWRGGGSMYRPLSER